MVGNDTALSVRDSIGNHFLAASAKKIGTDSKTVAAAETQNSLFL